MLIWICLFAQTIVSFTISIFADIRLWDIASRYSYTDKVSNSLYGFEYYPILSVQDNGMV